MRVLQQRALALVAWAAAAWLLASWNWLEAESQANVRVALSVSPKEAEPDVVGLVDVRRGADVSGRGASRGNQLPLIARPLGMFHWSPVTDDGVEGFIFDSTSKNLAAIRCTHQPSPWVGDYAFFDVMPVVLPEVPGVPVRMDWPGALLSPHYADIELSSLCKGGQCARVQLTATERGGVVRGVYPADLALKYGLRCAHLSGLAGEQVGPRTFRLSGVAGRWSVYQRNTNVLMFVVVEISVSGHGGLVFEDNRGLVTWRSVNGTRAEERDDMVVEARVGTSFLSHAMARLALRRELGARPFPSLLAEGRAAWQALLGRVTARAGAEQPWAEERELRTMLYTALYRALLFPRQLGELDEQGRLVHWSPYEWSTDTTRRAHPGPLSTDSGFWDSYITVYPLLHLFYPDLAEQVLEGWVSAVRESPTRSLAQWASPHSVDSMNGAMGEVSLAEAIVNGALGRDSEAVAYAYLLQNSMLPRGDRTEPGDGGASAAQAGSAASRFAPLTDMPMRAPPAEEAAREDKILQEDAADEAERRAFRARLERMTMPQAKLETSGEARSDPYEPTGFPEPLPLESEPPRRAHLGLYERLGFLPSRVGHSVSLSQSYYLSDWAVAQAARKLGDEVTARKLGERSRGWRELFDPVLKMFRPRSQLGAFVAHPLRSIASDKDGAFDEFWWNEAFTEGGPWQYRFFVPHDPQGLRREYEAPPPRAAKPPVKTPAAHRVLDTDAPSVLCLRLREMMSAPAHIEANAMLHEMTEMVELAFGQYAHGNQPSHHVLYMFAHAGCPLEGQRWLQYTLRALYGPAGFAGDEDNGEMSAWYALSSLGLFALAPGSGAYQLGAAPLFRSVTIRRPAALKSGRKVGTLTVRRDEALALVGDARGPDFEPARTARWRRPHGSEQLLDLAAGAVHIPYKELLEGGELVFA